jgi:hypothetical protein
MGVELIASMGLGHVFGNILHRFKSTFVESGTLLFRQGDKIQEHSPIYILANGQVKVLIDPNFSSKIHQPDEAPQLAATSEASGCRCCFTSPITAPSPVEELDCSRIQQSLLGHHSDHNVELHNDISDFDIATHGGL